MITLILYLISAWYYAKKETKKVKDELAYNTIFCINFIFWPLFIVLSWFSKKQKTIIL